MEVRDIVKYVPAVSSADRIGLKESFPPNDVD